MRKVRKKLFSLLLMLRWKVWRENIFPDFLMDVFLKIDLSVRCDKMKSDLPKVPVILLHNKQ